MREPKVHFEGRDMPASEFFEIVRNRAATIKPARDHDTDRVFQMLATSDIGIGLWNTHHAN